MRAQERSRLSDALDANERDSLKRHIAWLATEIATRDKSIVARIRACSNLAHAYTRLRSAPGVGPVAATTLIALLPGLGTHSPKTIAALVGLAPLKRDSGQFRGTRHIAAGKPPKVALVAIARKPLVILNAMTRNQIAYAP